MSSWGPRAASWARRLGSGWGPIALLAGTSALLLSTTIVRFVLAAPLQVTDLNVPPTDPTQTNIAFGSAWYYAGLGSPNHLSLYLTLQALVGSVSRNPAVAQSIVYLAPLLLAPVAAFLYFRAIGLRPIPTVIFAVGYELSPWLSYNFLGGEPLFTWLFALFPLVLLGFHEVGKHPRSWGPYLLVAAVFVAGVGLTLQAMDLFMLLAVPSLVHRLTLRERTGAFAIVLVTGMAAGLALAASAAGIPAYTSAAATETTLAGSSIFAGFRGVSAEALRGLALAFTGFLGAETLILVSGPARRRPEVGYGLGFSLVGSVAAVLLALIPGEGSYWVFTHLPVLTPFLNIDKFVLLAWLATLVNGALLAQRGPELVSQLERWWHSQRPRPTTASTREASPGWGLPRRGTGATAIVAATVVGAVFLVSVGFAPPGTSPMSLVAGGATLTPHHIPAGYFAVESYLLGHGVSFGFGPRTLVLPTNPGEILPFYVATTVIPGYLRPSPEMINITAAVLSNDSGVTKLLALLGVEYLVVPPTPAAPWWPTGASGAPTSAGIAPGQYIAQGDPARYVSTFHNWSTLTRVYNSSGFSIFANREYVGPIYAFSDQSGVDAVASGRDWSTLNLTPLGANVVANPALTRGTNATSVVLDAAQAGNVTTGGPNLIPDPDLLPGGGWGTTTSGNASLLPNGSFRLSFGSRGIAASEAVSIGAGTCYLFGYDLTTHPGYATYPPGWANRTYAGVYWSGGGIVLPQVVGNASGPSYFGLRVPSGSNVTGATIIVHAEPPLSRGVIFTQFANLSLRTAACKEFGFAFQPQGWVAAFGSGSVERNGSLRVPFGSNGLSVEQTVDLNASSTYALSFRVVSDPAYTSYPPAGIHRTYAAVYWAGGGAVFDQYAGPVNLSVAYRLQTPPSLTGRLAATVVLSSEAPLATGTIETQYQALDLQRLDGRDTFSTLIRPLSWTGSSATQFEIRLPTTVLPAHIVLPITFAAGWSARTAAGANVPVGPGPLGLLTLGPTVGSGAITLNYGPETTFLVESSGGLAVLLVTSGGTLVWGCARRWYSRPLRSDPAAVETADASL
ncbi:MAG: hypothetical protein L3J97_02770 [Thermoplasmata archaeon]|nr:hypothetical protein [Thermoplasmata archaeon]